MRAANAIVPLMLPRSSYVGSSRWVSLLAALLIATLMLSASGGLAASSIADLGKPTNEVAQDQPLAPFARLGSIFRVHGRPVLLFIGSQADPGSAAERWPIVKALDQFGSWSGLRSSTSGSKPGSDLRFGVVPTFDWLHARYRSRYLTFVRTELWDPEHHPLAKVSAMERPFVAWHPPGTSPNAWPYPVVVIDHYITHGSGIPPGVFQDEQQHNYSFAAVQQALQRHTASSDAYELAYQINVQANIITALICHEDGKRPANVCARPVIKGILKHVR